MIEQYFKEAKKVIKDAKNGKIRPHMEFLDMTTERSFRMSNRASFGMGRYMIIVGPSGTGKTSLADTELIINPILKQFLTEPEKRTNIEVIYRSMERPPVDKMVKWIAYLLYWKNKTLLDVSTLLQLPNKKRDLTEQDIINIDNLSPYIEYLSECITLLGGARTPSELYEYNISQIYKNGAYFKTDMDHIYCNGKKVASFPTQDQKEKILTTSPAKFDFGKDAKGNIFVSIKKEGKDEIFLTQQSQKFIPSDNSKLIIVINDTINKIQGDDPFKTLNAHSRFMGELRDAGAVAGIDISQMSKEDTKSMDGSLHVTQGHVKGSGDIPNNADIIISILDPLHYDISVYEPAEGSYDANRLRGGLRIVQIVKNSHGLSIHKYPFFMVGENGYFYELPPMGMTEQDYNYIEEKILLKKQTEGAQEILFTSPIDNVTVRREFNSKSPF